MCVIVCVCYGVCDDGVCMCVMMCVYVCDDGVCMCVMTVCVGAECRMLEESGVMHCVVDDGEEITSYPNLSCRMHLVKPQ